MKWESASRECSVSASTVARARGAPSYETHRAADLQAGPQLEPEFVVARLELGPPLDVSRSFPVGDLDHGRARVDVHLRSAAAVRPSVATLAGARRGDRAQTCAWATGSPVSVVTITVNRSLVCNRSSISRSTPAASSIWSSFAPSVPVVAAADQVPGMRPSKRNRPSVSVVRRGNMSSASHNCGSAPPKKSRSISSDTRMAVTPFAAVVQHSAGDRSAGLEFEKDGFVVARADARASEHRVARCPYAEVHEVGGEAFDSETTVGIGSRRSGRSPGSAVLPDGLDRGVGYRSSIGVGDDSVDHGADDQGEIADLEGPIRRPARRPALLVAGHTRSA